MQGEHSGEKWPLQRSRSSKVSRYRAHKRHAGSGVLGLAGAGRKVEVHQIDDGKQVLSRIVPLLLGLRGYLTDQAE